MSRLRNAWNAFRNTDEQQTELEVSYVGSGGFGGTRSARMSGWSTNRNSIIDPIYNRIGIDVASIPLRHVRVDEEDRYIEDIRSDLNNCLTMEPNIDQLPDSFIRDAVMSLCELGSIAIVPVDTRGNPYYGESYDILSLRIGQIVQFYARHVRVRLYDDVSGMYEEVLVPKTITAVVENPLYTVMNEPNSILQRLLKKLSVLDALDEQNSSGKLDIIIQLPYVLKTEAKKAEAEKRRKQIEDQLVGSKYGIAYTDGTERITQLNRPAENNVLAEVEWLTNMLYGQLGLTKEIVDGTADESAMINYNNRTIVPFLNALTQSMTRTFLSKTARTQGQRIESYSDPFRLVPVSQLAEIADKFTRNEIATKNDMRSAIGWKPSMDPKADELRNSNIAQSKDNPKMEELELERLRKEIELMGSQPPAPEPEKDLEDSDSEKDPDNGGNNRDERDKEDRV